jgi:(E)-4-hydroxy-3-methylbut-2-enyl-diphosphate synthase
MIDFIKEFNHSPYFRKRLETIEVNIGKVKIGAGNPIAIQSMTNTNPLDTIATVNQIISLYDAGCDIVRLAIPNIKSAHNLRNIKKMLYLKGYEKVPLVADIHFSYTLALSSIDHVEKVRINPGNFCEKVKFANKSYSDDLNQEALTHIEKTFSMLIKKAEAKNSAIRIGVNHGSLSERILSRYGNTIEGMVESAMEYLTIAQKYNFDNIVLSMKSSSPRIMVEAYWELIKRMYQLGKLYPLHLGVTESGSHIEGRIKSSIGIGSLLIDGLGDTIRVSLTEPPLNELPVARTIIGISEEYSKYKNRPYSLTEPHLDYEIQNQNKPFIDLPKYPIGMNNPIRVEIFVDKLIEDNEKNKGEMSPNDIIIPDNAEIVGMNIDKATIPLLKHINHKNKLVCLNIYGPDGINSFHQYVDKFDVIIDKDFTDEKLKEIIQICKKYHKTIQITINTNERDWLNRYQNILSFIDYEKIIFALIGNDKVHKYRLLYSLMRSKQETFPINIITENPIYEDKSSLYNILKTSIEIGSLLLDGIGEMISLSNFIDINYALDMVYNMLQSSETRISKAEFISCPSCGRTNFDIESITKTIKEKTSHLKGIKIAVMGCMVNGPGEMGEVDFGYIGGANNKVNLYVNSECVKRGINANNAVNELISLIKEYGKWIEPE